MAPRHVQRRRQIIHRDEPGAYRLVLTDFNNALHNRETFCDGLAVPCRRAAEGNIFCFSRNNWPTSIRPQDERDSSTLRQIRARRELERLHGALQGDGSSSNGLFDDAGALSNVSTLLSWTQLDDLLRQHLDSVIERNKTARPAEITRNDLLKIRIVAALAVLYAPWDEELWAIWYVSHARRYRRFLEIEYGSYRGFAYSDAREDAEENVLEECSRCGIALTIAALNTPTGQLFLSEKLMLKSRINPCNSAAAM